MSARAARNLGFQDGLAQPGEQPPLAVVSGRDLLGTPLKVQRRPVLRLTLRLNMVWSVLLECCSQRRALV